MKTFMKLLLGMFCCAILSGVGAASGLAWTPGDAPPQDGVLYGPHTSFFLVPPKGWVLDAQAGLGEGQLASYYPQGQTWRTSPVVAYAEICDKTEQIQSAQPVLESLLQKLRAKDPNLVFFKAGEVANKQARRAPIYHFFYTENGGKAGLAVAFYDGPRSIDMVVLRGKNVEAFNAALPAFHELAGSYFFLSSNVHLP
jgi:hypothetical protein